MLTFKEFKRRVQEQGLVAKDCGAGHWRVEGGRFEVNWWPTSRRKTIYVNGQTRERTTRQGDLEEVLRLATTDPKLGSRFERTGRKKNYTRVKKRKFKKNKSCHWCSGELTLDKATIDHVIPLARGGSNADDNLVLSCAPCNTEKGHEIWDKEGLKDGREEKKNGTESTGRDLGGSKI